MEIGIFRSSPLKKAAKIMADADVGVVDDRPSGDIRGIVLFFTGYRSHAGTYIKFRTELKENGYWVRTIELPNHGGGRGNLHGVIEDFKVVPKIVRAAVLLLRNDALFQKELVFLIGHSTGVLAILQALINCVRLRYLIAGVVAFSSPFRLDKNAIKFMRRLEPLMEWLVKHIKFTRRWRLDFKVLAPGVRKGVTQEQKEDPYYFSKGIELWTMLQIHLASKKLYERLRKSGLKINSLLVLHGKKDRRAREKYAKRAYKKVEGSDITYRSLKGVGHDFDTEVVAIILEWLNNRTKSNDDLLDNSKHS